jgi:signal transduction histidine kinase
MAGAPGNVREILSRYDDERRQLAGVLHDDVTDGLAALISHLDLIEQSDPMIAARTRALLEESRAIARRCFEDVRRVVDALAPRIAAEIGLPLAVQCAAGSFAERTGVHVRVKSAEAVRLAGNIEVAVLRLIDEWLEDVAAGPRHDEPSIALAVTGRSLTVAIEPVLAETARTWRSRLQLQFGRTIRQHTEALGDVARAPEDREPMVRVLITAAVVPPDRP